VEAAADDAVVDLLGLDRSEDFGAAEAEAPDVSLWIGNPELRPDLERMQAALEQAQWHGCANQLSSGHTKWPDIDSIHRATHKAPTREPTSPNPELGPSPATPALDLSFARIARKRRSAVNFDGTTRITDAAFFSMLACLEARAPRLDPSEAVFAKGARRLNVARSPHFPCRCAAN
jgi:hypothetical protein